MSHPQIAYVSMEIAISPQIPTYSGGLGVLAGDLIRAAADAGAPMVGVTLLYREGYFRQRLDATGRQHEEPQRWDPASLLDPTPILVKVPISGRLVAARVWRYDAIGCDGARVPVYLLDSDLEENDDAARALCSQLYGGDARYRLEQETLLGFGAVALLHALGWVALPTYHLNEGHSALVVLALLEALHDKADDEALALVRERCVFTTHTPIPAGHDRFDPHLTAHVLGAERVEMLRAVGALRDEWLDMTYLALRGARYANAVSARHGEVTRAMFPRFPIATITNGVHAATWAAQPFRALFDRHVPGWRRDNAALREIAAVPLAEVAQAHAETKAALAARVGDATGTPLDPRVFTIGFARRATGYKRNALLLRDPARLRAIAQAAGGLQIVYGGKAHPRDDGGKAEIERVHAVAGELRDAVRIVYLEDYEMTWASLLVSGSDLWLNTPLPPNEASGTSGMKAAVNGVPSLSVRDGWWIEGGFDGVTGFSIDEHTALDDARTAEAIYQILGERILPAYANGDAFVRMRRDAIAINGSHFTAQRMLDQYTLDAYLRRRVLIELAPSVPDELLQRRIG